ncbi:MAG: Uncharacterised protein [Owenweeksia sp. TMED14]|nr:MAG: Uncharacterised protein [Owenweeksia sp. TMED14]
MKNLFLIICFACISIASKSQTISYTSITDLQYVSSTDLANCNDTSSYYGDTVMTYGIVVVPGDVSEVASGSVQGGHRPFVFIVDTVAQGLPGAFRGIEIMGAYNNNQGQLLPLSNIEYLLPGDLIQFTGRLSDYNNGTQIEAINGNSLQVIGTRPIPTPAQISIGELNDALRVNILTSGEKWENSFVEFNNVTVTEVIPFGGNRISFNCVDGSGNKINVSDRFLAQKTPSWQTVNPYSPQSTGSFLTPVPGTFYSSLKGMVRHDGNGCLMNSGSRGYELNPFDSSHYQIAYAPPYISNFERDPMVPTPNQSVELICSITDFDGTVDSVFIYFSSDTSLNSSQFGKLSMTLSAGSTDEYEVIIPNFANGTFVRYFIKAIDNESNASFYPTTPVGQLEPNVDYYTVRQNGLLVKDLQYSLANNGNSPYTGLNISVKGIVTASTKQHDLGFLYIQDSGGGPWSGIWCVGSGITQFFRNEEVQVSGTVEEYYGMTRLNVSSINKTGQLQQPIATIINPSDSLSKYGYAWEKHEGCLVRLKDPNSQDLLISQTNLGFGDYAVSNSIGAGYWNRSIVSSGRQSATSFSSLFVQLVADLRYDTIDGQMEVSPIAVSDTMKMNALDGILFYAFSNYRVLPRNNDDFIGINTILDSTNLPASSIGIIAETWKPDIIFLAYPNPAQNELTLEGPKNSKWKILDMMGRPLLSGVIENEKEQVSVGWLSNGTYLLHLVHKTESRVYKIILSR